jgi:hypothetical protein
LSDEEVGDRVRRIEEESYRTHVVDRHQVFWNSLSEQGRAAIHSFIAERIVPGMNVVLSRTPNFPSAEHGRLIRQACAKRAALKSGRSVTRGGIAV